MGDITHLLADPAAWLALVTLVVMEVVLGIDNLVFISILTNKLPDAHRGRIRTLGIALALVLRLALLSTIAFIVSLTRPVFSLGDHPVSWRDMILIAGGLFLLWKATREIHESVRPEPEHSAEGKAAHGKVTGSLAAVVVQIVALDMVFSIDSILTAVGMTDHLPIMMAAVVVAVLLMMVASGPLADFIKRNPSVVMLALGFLLMIGVTLIADGSGFHIPKGYIYTAMAFSVLVEALNMLARRKAAKPPAD
ncbi:MAG: TerC family protein [Caulobacteraceae bacterium]|nr:TerC family protein [Caulobacter sp.]